MARMIEVLLRDYTPGVLDVPALPYVVEGLHIAPVPFAMPISRIVLDCGFAHQSHMARHMRRLTGSTPAEYALRSPIRRNKRSRGAAF